MVNEIFVLADDDCLLVSSAFPNHRIVSGFKTQSEDMRGLMTLVFNPTSQCGRELRIK
jgi:hypothetical protein